MPKAASRLPFTLADCALSIVHWYYSGADNQLKTLIALYEEEERGLQNFIKECLAGEEYLLAHYHSNALYQLNGQLQTLRNIDDGLYDAKQLLMKRIDILEKQNNQLDPGHLKEYLSKELIKAKESLEKLNQAPSKTIRERKSLTPVLDGILHRLLYKKVKKVKLVPKKRTTSF